MMSSDVVHSSLTAPSLHSIPFVYHGQRFIKAADKHGCTQASENDLRKPVHATRGRPPNRTNIEKKKITKAPKLCTLLTWTEHAVSVQTRVVLHTTADSHYEFALAPSFHCLLVMPALRHHRKLFLT